MESKSYVVNIIEVPDYIVGGPYMVQAVERGSMRVAALTKFVATRERAESVATEYRNFYPNSRN